MLTVKVMVDAGDRGSYLLETGFGPLGTSCLLASNSEVELRLFGRRFMDRDEEGDRSRLLLLLLLLLLVNETLMLILS